MRRIISLALLAGLIATSLLPTTPAAARKPKPVKTTLYMHGAEIVGEAENQQVSGSYLPMDTKKPKGDVPKSYIITNLVATPNTNCAGNFLFPNWSGALRGTVKGNLTVTFYFAGTPGNVDVRVWPDVNALSCNEGYIKEAAFGRMMAMPGKNTIVLKKAKFQSLGSLLLQISPVNVQTEASPAVVPPVEGRVLYDAKGYETKVTFMCTPKRGKKCA
jgi:hypothetical protein